MAYQYRKRNTSRKYARKTSASQTTSKIVAAVLKALKKKTPTRRNTSIKRRTVQYTRKRKYYNPYSNEINRMIDLESVRRAQMRNAARRQIAQAEMNGNDEAAAQAAADYNAADMPADPPAVRQQRSQAAGPSHFASMLVEAAVQAGEEEAYEGTPDLLPNYHAEQPRVILPTASF